MGSAYAQLADANADLVAAKADLAYQELVTDVATANTALTAANLALSEARPQRPVPLPLEDVAVLITARDAAQTASRHRSGSARRRR